MAWSPASWDVKVNLPSRGPVDFTTTSPDGSSYGDEDVGSLEDRQKKNTNMYVNDNTQLRIFDIFTLLF